MVVAAPTRPTLSLAIFVTEDPLANIVQIDTVLHDFLAESQDIVKDDHGDLFETYCLLHYYLGTNLYFLRTLTPLGWNLNYLLVDRHLRRRCNIKGLPRVEK